VKPNNIILEGVTGSTAYGLDTETSVDSPIRAADNGSKAMLVRMGGNNVGTRFNSKSIDHHEKSLLHGELFSWCG
jgi:hypothetical protein